MRDELIRVLNSLDFQCQELMLTPTQFGIPNSRLRYYLLAKRRPLSFCFEISHQLIKDVPCCATKQSNSEASCIHRQCAQCSIPSSVMLSLRDFVEYTASSDHLHQYAVPVALYKHFWTMDIVTPQATHSCCFTKRYGRHLEGAGSVLQMSSSTKTVSQQMGAEEFQSAVDSYRLRFFTPREVANLLCLPQTFLLAEEKLSARQLYQVLGNSISIRVVSVLIHLLTTDTCS